MTYWATKNMTYWATKKNKQNKTKKSPYGSPISRLEAKHWKLYSYNNQ